MIDLQYSTDLTLPSRPHYVCLTISRLTVKILQAGWRTPRLKVRHWPQADPSITFPPSTTIIIKFVNQLLSAASRVSADGFATHKAQNQFIYNRKFDCRHRTFDDLQSKVRLISPSFGCEPSHFWPWITALSLPRSTSRGLTRPNFGRLRVALSDVVSSKVRIQIPHFQNCKTESSN